MLSVRGFAVQRPGQDGRAATASCCPPHPRLPSFHERRVRPIALVPVRSPIQLPLDERNPAISTLTTIRGKLAGDAAWNYGAFVLMAGAGALINLFIAAVRGAEALGVFNQAYAVFIVAGQLATVGLHDSAQKHMAHHDADLAAQSSISRAAIICTMTTGTAVAVLLFLLAPTLGRVTDSAAVGTAIATVAPGILLFGVNKTFMGLLNGARRMRAYAIAQSTRVAVILTVVVAVGLSEGPDWMLVLGFTVAETVLVVGLLVTTRRHWSAPSDATAVRSWMRDHFQFGTRALPNAFLAESFVRIDVLMLGLFVTDSSVGYYSFAAIFVEGLYQLPVVIRTVVNPVLVRLFISESKAVLAAFCRRLAGLSLAVFVPIALVVYAGFPFLELIVDPEMVMRSRALLPALLAGLLVYSAFIPVDHLMLQAGMPGRQSILMVANVMINIVLNALLIPRYGVLGAAVATGSAYALSGLTLTVAARAWLGMPRGLFLPPR